MERLTKRFEDGRSILCVKTKAKGHEGQAEGNIKAINRLAELEDKTESGQLVELPCKVGDIVWFLPAFMPKYQLFIEPYSVSEIVIRNGISIMCAKTLLDGKLHNEMCICEADFGKYLFFDKAEAEARLRELQAK